MNLFKCRYQFLSLPELGSVAEEVGDTSTSGFRLLLDRFLLDFLPFSLSRCKFGEAISSIAVWGEFVSKYTA